MSTNFNRKSDTDAKKVTTNSTIVYNATPINQIGQPKIQILEPPVVYKPTPKSLLASYSSYSPPVKKLKLEYVPKSKSNFTSIATYVPSTSIKSTSDNECEVQKCGWDYLSEIIDSKSSTNSVDKTLTYIPTKIDRSTSEDVVAESANNVVKSTENEIDNKTLTDDETERKRSKSKHEKNKSRRDRHKSSSKSTSRSHSHSSKNKHENSSKTSSDRSKPSKSTHRSSHDKSKSHSSRSDSKSSLDRNGSELKRADKNQHSSTVTKPSKLSSKSVDKKEDGDDADVLTKKTKSITASSSTSKRESTEIVPINSDNNVSPSSVFDTDSEEDDVMAQCRMIFEEFKEVSNNGKSNDVVVSYTPLSILFVLIAKIVG